MPITRWGSASPGRDKCRVFVSWFIIPGLFQGYIDCACVLLHENVFCFSFLFFYFLFCSSNEMFSCSILKVDLGTHMLWLLL